jgi:molybdopterin molybdotransferase
MCHTMISAGEALELVMQAASPRPPRPVPLAEACGLCLAEDVFADRDYPPFARATMDGFAVRLADAGRTVTVLGEIPAGCVSGSDLGNGQCLEISTGAVCPPAAEAVVPGEHVARREGRVLLPAKIEMGQNIAPQGSECRQGRRVLAAGDVVTPLAMAVMASFGVLSIRVVPRPSIGIITTGAELIPPGRQPAPGKIRDANGPMLLALASAMQIERPVHLGATDRLETIVETLQRVADRDLVLLSGGVSVGAYDLVPRALTQYGAEIIFHKVKQKPGKPLLLARKDRQLLFGLPGNPLACHLGFQRYVAAAIRRMAGQAAVAAPFYGELAQAVEAKGDRTHFAPARAEYAPALRTSWRLEVPPTVSSADIFNSCRANCYVEVPPGNDGLAAGQTAAFTWFAGPPTAGGGPR